MSAVTKEGIEVKVDQVWRDLDNRMNRQCVVVEVRDGKAIMSVIGAIPYRTTTVSIRRMHKTSTGWALVSEASS